MGVLLRFMQAGKDSKRTESALYWSAVSMIVCEGMPLDEAAQRLGVDSETLHELLSRRQDVPLDVPPVEKPHL